MTHYLEFLAEAHRILEPRGYLEIGVRHGDSLRLASCPAIGIDPQSRLSYEPRPNERISHETSNGFFALEELNHSIDFPLDLAFIDGMHLIENALRDFANIEKYSNERTVVIFDDVLPYNREIASRIPPTGGDWTGDVWRVWPTLNGFRPDLDMVLVDTEPTGLLLVAGLDPSNRALETWFRDFEAGILSSSPAFRDGAPNHVPSYTLRRLNALPPSEAYDWLRAGLQ